MVGEIPLLCMGPGQGQPSPRLPPSGGTGRSRRVELGGDARSHVDDGEPHAPGNPGEMRKERSLEAQCPNKIPTFQPKLAICKY